MAKNENLRFNLTEDMNDMMIEMLIVQQMLSNDKFDKEDKILLENHKQRLMKEFTKEFQKNNIEPITLYNKMIKK